MTYCLITYGLLGSILIIELEDHGVELFIIGLHIDNLSVVVHNFGSGQTVVVIIIEEHVKRSVISFALHILYNRTQTIYMRNSTELVVLALEPVHPMDMLAV